MYGKAPGVACIPRPALPALRRPASKKHAPSREELGAKVTGDHRNASPGER